jgi:hypothetical protein
MFESSFNATLDRYRLLLVEERGGLRTLLNDNFDLGETSGPGKYQLNDETYAKLLDRLADLKFAGVSPELRARLLEFYSDLNAPYTTKKDVTAWTRVQGEIEQLKSFTPQAVPAVSATTP